MLSSRVARLLSSYFLAIRRLEEAQLVLEKTPASAEPWAKVSAELIELYFLRLRLRLDPERDAPATREADVAAAAVRGDAPAVFERRHQAARTPTSTSSSGAATSTPVSSIAPSRCSSRARAGPNRTPR